MGELKYRSKNEHFFVTQNTHRLRVSAPVSTFIAGIPPPDVTATTKSLSQLMSRSQIYTAR